MHQTPIFRGSGRLQNLTIFFPTKPTTYFNQIISESKYDQAACFNAEPVQNLSGGHHPGGQKCIGDNNIEFQQVFHRFSFYDNSVSPTKTSKDSKVKPPAKTFAHIKTSIQRNVVSIKIIYTNNMKINGENKCIGFQDQQYQNGN